MKRRLIEGYWDCEYCGAKKILRSTQNCPNCGNACNENTTFYLKGEHHYVSPKMAATINRNPNWVCAYCGNLNPDDNTTCYSCAAPRTEETLNYFENKKKQQQETMSSIKKEKEETEEKINNYDTYNHSNNKNPSSNSFHFNIEILKYVLIGLFSLLAVVGLIWLFIPKNKEITISEMYWERCINIERYQTVEESDWVLPSNARLLFSQSEFSHYEDVLDHYETRTREVPKERISGYEEYVVGIEDLGNGYFEEIIDSRPVYETYYETETYEEPIYRNEPVYRTKYYYEIDKWLYERCVKSNAFDKFPYWGEASLASDERVSSKNEIYYVHGTDKDGNLQRFSVTYEDWSIIEIGQTLEFKVSVLGNATLVK